MSTFSSHLPITGLRSVHNARTRVFAAGRDPLFGSVGRFPTKRLTRPYPDVGRPSERLWQPDLLDRLQTPVTRFRD